MSITRIANFELRISDWSMPEIDTGLQSAIQNLGHAENFLGGGQALGDFDPAVLPEGPQLPLLLGGMRNLMRRGTLEHQALDRLGQLEKLVDRCPASVAGPFTLRASSAIAQRLRNLDRWTASAV